MAEIFTIPLEKNKYLIYAPLRRSAFVANGKVVNFLVHLSQGNLSFLEEEKEMIAFLQSLEILNGEEEPFPITTFSGPPEPTSVTLFLTTACNLRCIYCYASAGDAPRRSMPLDVARRGIDFVSRNAKKKGASYFEVSYHGGGEPTVHWKVLTESLEYAKEKGQKMGLEVKSSSATNGVLKDFQMDWILENMQGVSLSFDGLPQVHDANRPFASGKGSSEDVLRTLERFEGAGLPYGIRLTITKEHIPHLPGSIQFICEKFHPCSIQVEPSYQMGRWKDAPSAETEEFISAFRKAQKIAFSCEREIQFSGARLDTLSNHFCGISQDNFSLSPDGNVSACYEVFSEENPWSNVFFYGKPDSEGEGYIFNLEALNHLRKQTVENREYCKGCFAKWNCAGDCYHKSLTVHQNLEFSGSDRCHIIRELTKDQILVRIAASGGLFWHGWRRG